MTTGYLRNLKILIRATQVQKKKINYLSHNSSNALFMVPVGSSVVLMLVLAVLSNHVIAYLVE